MKHISIIIYIPKYTIPLNPPQFIKMGKFLYTKFILTIMRAIDKLYYTRIVPLSIKCSIQSNIICIVINFRIHNILYKILYVNYICSTKKN